MSLFKIFKGNDSSKITDSSVSGYKTPVDGYAYYDTSSKLFYIDANYDTSNPNSITREAINANKANGANLVTTQNSIVKFGNADGLFANSGVVIDGIDNVSGVNNLTIGGEFIGAEDSLYGSVLPAGSEGQVFFQPMTGGILKTDLESSVQASLDKADAAVPAGTPTNGVLTKNYSTSNIYGGICYRRNGMVLLTAYVSGLDIVSGTIMTVPAGFRPPQAFGFYVPIYNQSAVMQIGAVNIGTDGTVTAAWSSGANHITGVCINVTYPISE